MTSSLPVYSAMTAAAVLVLQLGLMMSVGMRRLRTGQGIGDGGDAALALSIRRHGNLAENGAMFVVALACLETIGGPPTVVMTLGACFVLVRIAHAVGLSLGTGPNFPRFIGAMGTTACGVATAGYIVFTVLA